MKARTRLRFALGTIFVLGIVLVVVPWHEIRHANGEEFLASWAIRLTEGVGEALAIAAILGWFVDEAAKRELLEDVLDDVSAHIAGRLLEPTLREFIETYLKADLVRAKWDITYVISDWPGQPTNTEYKKLVTRSITRWRTGPHHPKIYPCVYEVEKSLFPEIGEAKILNVTGRALVGSSDTFSSADFPSGFSNTESNIKFEHLSRFGHPHPPRSRTEGNTRNCSWTRSRRMLFILNRKSSSVRARSTRSLLGALSLRPR